MKHFAISAHRDGFRRAGRAWDRQATVVSVEDLTDEQLEQLRADPNITITPHAPEGEAPSAAAGAPAAEMKAAVAAARPYEVMEELAARLAVTDLEFWLIRAAIRTLDKDDPDHFTKAGVPEVAALERVTGLKKISAARRDLAWEQHLEAQFPHPGPPPGGGD